MMDNIKLANDIDKIKDEFSEKVIVKQVQTANNDVVKKEIAKVEYGINYKKSESDDLPTESQVTKILILTNTVQKNQKEENYSKPISNNDLDELIKNGYTKEEVISLNNLGATAIVLKKLNNPAIELNPSETIECINTFIKMGMVEAAKVSNQNLVLIVGYTGVGKSTAVNYLHGCEMEKISDPNIISIKKTSLIKEVVTIGHANSKTFIPTVIPSPETGINFCDCPGFFDNRGQEINIANAVNIRNIIEDAETIKIILLIDYQTACDPRQLNNNNLKKMLIDLFGTEDKLNENLSSIQLGITQVPLEIDGTKITLEDIKSNLIKMKYFPELLCTNAKIMDPLNRRTFKDLKELCSREDWLLAIKKLTPIKKDQLLFNTILIPEDKLKLQGISERISKEISKDLASYNHIAAAKNLEQMHYLKIINHTHINILYEKTLEVINRHSKRMVRDIEGLADDKKFVEVIQMMKEYQQFIIFFKEAIPELTKTFIKLLSYIRTEQSKYYSENANDLIAEIAKYFHQNPEIQLHLSYSLHRLLNHSQPAISDPQALHYLAGYLKELITLDTNMAKLVTELSNCLAEFTTLAIKLEKRTIIEEIEKNLYEELNKIAKTAYHIHRNSVIEKLKSIKIVMLEQLDKLNSSIFWENNGKNILSIIYAFENDIQRKALVDLLAQLACEPSIKEEAQSLQEQLIKAEKLTASIEDDDVEKETLDALQLPKIVKEKLLEIKGRLVTKQKEEEVKTVIKDIVNSIEQNKFDVTPDLLSRLSNLTEEQLLVIKQDKTISQLVKEKLKDCLTEIESNINWETNGKAILEILKSYEAPMNRSKIDSILTDIQTISNIQLPASKIYYVLIFLNEIYDKLYIKPENYIATIEEILTRIQVNLKIKHVEDEALGLVVNINNELLPNNRFGEINVAILRLIEIAPEKLKMITLEKEIKNYKINFSTQLNTNNYNAAKNLLILLKDFKANLTGVLKDLKIEFEIATLEQEILKHICDIVIIVKKEMEEAFSSKSLEDTKKSFISLTFLGNFFSAAEKFQQISEVQKYLDEVRTCCTKVVERTYECYKNTYDTIVYAKLLIQTQHLTNQIGSRSASFTLSIRDAVGKFIQFRSNDNDFLFGVSHALMQKVSNDSEESRYANEVISGYPEFKRAEIAVYRSKTRDRKAEDILEEMQVVNMKLFKKCFQTYLEEYENIINNIIDNFEKENECKILSSAVEKAKEQGKKLQDTNKYSQYPDNVAIMVANIFGVWSYLDAHSGGFKKDRATLKEPHAAQAISILLLFGMDRDNEVIQNHFLQVKTGEGKSIITAGAAIAFALVGYQVSIACYNPWLAERDERDFSNLFVNFKLNEMIQYGDFNVQVNKQMNNLCDLESIVYQLMRGIFVEGNQVKNEKSLLFVDEVDVFFTDSFLGKLFKKGVELSSDSYKTLLLEIWENRQKYLNQDINTFVKDITSHDLFEKFLIDYPNISTFIKPFIINMYEGLTSVCNNTHSYTCRDKEIQYLDTAANKYRPNKQGHATVFATIKEYKDNKISKECYDQNTQLYISCGQYSIAEFPVNFDLILGVTGTLFTFSEYENNLLRKYNINRKTAIPSVFKKEQLKGASDVKVFSGKINADDEKGYFWNIKNAAVKALHQDRAVLIVFENEARLKDYENYFNIHLSTTEKVVINKLLTSTTDKNRDVIVAEAASRNHITMMIREFGRGTDFVCRDSQLRNSGGILVICTFFPEHEAEEVQIKGRTCRQNDPGSFEMILFLEDLKKFNINFLNEFDNTQKSNYQFLYDKRNELQAVKAIKIQKNLDAAKQIHDKTLKLASLLSKNSIFNKDPAIELLQELNKTSNFKAHRTRTICLMDATGSMEKLLQKCKETVGEMFKRASEILKEKSIQPDSFEIQFCVYRNYNAKEDELLQQSKWETVPDNLCTFMNEILACHGMGNEAIEIGLWHANKEHENAHISQVILIGDMPANSKEEITERRKKPHGEAYWEKTKFNKQTNYEEELVKLISNNIPVHAFYVDQQAKEMFQEIAEKTKGKCEFLDINSNLGAEQLTELVTQEILRSVGGDENGNELVVAYQNKYKEQKYHSSLSNKVN